MTVYYESADKTTYPKNTKAPTDAGAYEVTFDVAEGKNYSGATGLEIGKLLITQVAYSAHLLVNSAAEIGENGQVDLSGLIAPGGTANIGKKDDTNNILGDNLTVTLDKKLSFSIKSTAQAKQTATVEVKVTAKNYKDYTIKVTLTATQKEPQKPLMFTNKNNATVTYGQTLQLGTKGGTTNGKVTYEITPHYRRELRWMKKACLPPREWGRLASRLPWPETIPMRPPQPSFSSPSPRPPSRYRFLTRRFMWATPSPALPRRIPITP